MSHGTLRRKSLAAATFVILRRSPQRPTKNVVCAAFVSVAVDAARPSRLSSYRTWSSPGREGVSCDTRLLRSPEQTLGCLLRAGDWRQGCLRSHEVLDRGADLFLHFAV